MSKSQSWESDRVQSLRIANPESTASACCRHPAGREGLICAARLWQPVPRATGAEQGRGARHSVRAAGRWILERRARSDAFYPVFTAYW